MNKKEKQGIAVLLALVLMFTGFYAAGFMMGYQKGQLTILETKVKHHVRLIL